jgi:hypothetical protein
LGLVTQDSRGQQIGERSALAFAASTTGVCFYLVPAWEPVAFLSDPCGVATLAAGLLILTASAHRRGEISRRVRMIPAADKLQDKRRH